MPDTRAEITSKSSAQALTKTEDSADIVDQEIQQGEEPTSPDEHGPGSPTTLVGHDSSVDAEHGNDGMRESLGHAPW